MFVETGYHEKEVEVKADPFKLETLIAWLETKNPAEEYQYSNNYKCCLAQYFQAHGYPHACLSSAAVYLNGPFGKRTPLPHGFNKSAMQFDRTFGGALRMARAVEAGTV